MRSYLPWIVLLSLALACTSAKPRTADGDSTVFAVPNLDLRAILLLIADRQVFEPVAIEQALKGNAELREELAVTLGRIPDPQGRSLLQGLLIDETPAVRRAAAFALGELEDQDAVAALLQAARDPDRETGGLAVEALGKLGAPVVDVAQSLLGLPDPERWGRILPPLFRFKEAARVQIAERGLERPEKDLHARAAYALAREPLPEAVPALRRLVADPDAQVRAWAARGLGIAGDASDLPRLRPRLDDPEPGPIVQALQAVRRLVTEKKAAAPDDWQPRLLALVGDPRPGVRVTAIEAAQVWKLDAPLTAALARLAREGEGRERGLALVALARSGAPEASDLITAAAAAPSTPDADVRARAAEAAQFLKQDERVRHLATADPSPLVRAAALSARLTDPAESAQLAAIREGIADADPGVLATALDWLTEHPRISLEALQRPVARALLDRNVEAGLSAVKAVAARAAAEPLERGAWIGWLEQVATKSPYVLRREAIAALGKLGRTTPPLGRSEVNTPEDTYKEILQRTRNPRTVQVQTNRGAFRIRLACPEAPLTCLNFLQLAAQKLYDGTPFHRVVPDFVVQGGDPRGDGFGGPGYAIRDEINRLRYERGAVGMALAGPDTGGSQFFVALSPQPHLDGGYTVFGKVSEGMEVVDQLRVGDRIERIVEE
jgi:cyclophilin family peptidyl-prolyl cis-trans isomerase/HEAT repeat protein